MRYGIQDDVPTSSPFGLLPAYFRCFVYSTRADVVASSKMAIIGIRKKRYECEIYSTYDTESLKRSFCMEETKFRNIFHTIRNGDKSLSSWLVKLVSIGNRFVLIGTDCQYRGYNNTITSQLSIFISIDCEMYNNLQVCDISASEFKCNYPIISNIICAPPARITVDDTIVSGDILREVQG